MLQNIRDKTQGIFASLVVGVIAFTFAIWGIHYYLEESKTNTVAIQVNSAKLTQEQFDRILRRDQRMFSIERPGASLTEAMQTQLKQSAIKQWVQTAILSQAADKAGFSVSPEALQQTLLSLETFQEQGQFSAQLYQQKLDYMGYTPEEFQRDLQDDLLIGQVQYGLVQTDFILPEELAQAAGLLYQTRDLGYLRIPAQLFSDKIKISDAAINDYYKSHLKNFMAPEKVTIDYIQIKPADLISRAPVSDAEIKTQYQTHQADFSSASTWQVSFVKLALPKGNDPKAALQKANALQAQMLKMNSFKPATDQGLTVNKTSVTLASAPPALAAVLTQSQEGQFLAPIVNNDGLLLFKVGAKQLGQVKPLTEVKQQIQTELKNQKTEKLMAELSDKLDSLSYENPTSLAVVSQQLDLPIQKSTWLTHNDTPSSSSFPAAVINAAFSDAVLAQGYNSDLLTLTDGSAMVLRVDQHKLSEAKPLTEVKANINNILMKQALQKAAQDKGQALLLALKQGAVPHTLAQKSNLVWQEVNHVSRTALNLDPELLSSIFTLPQGKQGQASLQGKSLSNGDYLILRLQSVHLGQINDLSEAEKSQLSQQWRQTLGKMDYAFYALSMKDEAKVKIKVNSQDSTAGAE